MQFHEFSAGQTIDVGPYIISEAEILAFATAYDPQWIHTDAQGAADGPYGGLIASGWQTCGITMRLFADAVLKGSNSFGSPGLAYVKWPHPVRPGDALHARATVLETRVASSRADLGVMRWRWQTFNALDVEVLDMEATTLFKLA